MDNQLFDTTNGDVLSLFLDSVDFNYSVIDVNGDYLVQNNRMVASISRGSVNAANIDLPSWEHCKEVMRVGTKVIKEEPFKGRYYLSIKQPLFDKGKCVGIRVLSFDITDRKLAEQKLEKALKQAEAANEAKSQFLENMRHDIRTPLSGIVGFAELIKAEADKPQKTREYADNLVASGRTLFDFLDEILDTIRTTSGELPLLNKKFNLKDALNKIVLLNGAKAAEKKLEFIYGYSKDLPCYVLGDRMRLQRILLELTNNALKFTSVGKVRVSVELAKKEADKITVRLIVRDTGIGIPDEKNEEIFERFVRLVPSYNGTCPGSGLGLSIVKQFVEELGGTISVESKKGKGSAFICLIPLQEAKLQDDSGIEHGTQGDISNLHNLPVLERTKPNSKRKKWKILLVEDDAFMGKLSRIILGRMKCAVDIASNGVKAIKLARANSYDLILMDIGLPDMDGYEVTRRIREQEVNKDNLVPIVALSAHSSAGYSKHCVEVGMNAVLSKPLTEEKARDLCVTFISGWREPTKTNKVLTDKKSTTTGKIINLVLMRKNYGNNEQMIRTIIASVKKDLPRKIKSFTLIYKNKDFKALRVMTHKIRGLASYCGAKRTQEACARLDDYLLEGKDPVIISKFYKQALAEVKVFQEQIAKVKNI
ncbi:MAG: ATP-binding protein [Gammaproteobacteria bacterium]